MSSGMHGFFASLWHSDSVCSKVDDLRIAVRVGQHECNSFWIQVTGAEQAQGECSVHYHIALASISQGTLVS